MACNWQAFLNLVPPRLRGEVDKLGKAQLQELRLRLQGEPELILPKESKWLPGPVTMDDLTYCINAATKYSPWAAASAEAVTVSFQLIFPESMASIMRSNVITLVTLAGASFSWELLSNSTVPVAASIKRALFPATDRPSG